MNNRIYGSVRRQQSAMSNDETRDRILRYLALIASDVTSGKLDPARVNWRYIRSQVTDALRY